MTDALTDLDRLPVLQIWDTVVARPIEGERITAAVVELDPNGVVPEHRHDHEQLGLVISGSVTFRVGDEQRELGPGGTWRIPSQAPHEVHAGPEGAVVVDIFCPVREDWRAAARVDRVPRWP
jgi:quercetin dioxygenase-like cupin family protein